MSTYKNHLPLANLYPSFPNIKIRKDRRFAFANWLIHSPAYSLLRLLRQSLCCFAPQNGLEKKEENLNNDKKQLLNSPPNLDGVVGSMVFMIWILFIKWNVFLYQLLKQPNSLIAEYRSFIKLNRYFLFKAFNKKLFQWFCYQGFTNISNCIIYFFVCINVAIYLIYLYAIIF